MLDKGYDIDEIFEGPALRHGFIENSAIENTDLYRDIRLSDIINAVTDIKGIKAITYLHLPFDGFNDKEIRLLKKFKSRWVTVFKQAPMIIMTEQEIYLKQSFDEGLVLPS